jgi:hypothetical protein
MHATLLLEAAPLHPPCSTVAIRKASANPSVVARPATAPPCSNASGIIVSASIVRIAPAANPCTIAIVAGGASPRSTNPSIDESPLTATTASQTTMIRETGRPAFTKPDVDVERHLAAAMARD